MNFSQQAENKLKTFQKLMMKLLEENFAWRFIIKPSFLLRAESKLPAPVLDFISLNRKKIFLDSKKVIDFLNELCYNKDNETNRSESKWKNLQLKTSYPNCWLHWFFCGCFGFYFLGLILFSIIQTATFSTAGIFLQSSFKKAGIYWNFQKIPNLD